MADESTGTKRGRGRPAGSRNKRTGAHRSRSAARASGPTHASTPARARGRTTLDEQPGGLTASLRAAVASEMKPCPHCGAEPRNKGKIAEAIGVSQMTLRKFVNGDGSVSSGALDRIYSYVNREKQA